MTGGEHFANDAHNITDIIGHENIILFRSDGVLANIALNPSQFILYINEGGFPHVTVGHDSSGYGHGLSFIGFVIILDVHAVGIHIPLFDQERIPAHFLKLLQFFPPNAPLLIQLFFRKLFLLFRGKDLILQFCITHCISLIY